MATKYELAAAPDSLVEVTLVNRPDFVDMPEDCFDPRAVGVLTGIERQQRPRTCPSCLD
jgi:hypothetical protein